VYVIITKITPEFPLQVKLEWTIREVETPETIYYSVERSGSPAGPWTTIIEDLEDTYEYIDPLDTENINVMSLGRDIYYRIKAITPEPKEIYSASVNLDGQAELIIQAPIPISGYGVDANYQFELDPATGQAENPILPGERLRLLRRKIIRDEYILLRKFAGIEYYLLKRRHFGTRCPDCYDPTTRSVTKSSCKTCYGTSWSGGYFNPVLILGRRSTSQIQSAVSQQAKVDVNLPHIQFLDFPRIDEEDVLVEKSLNKRFLVKSRYFTFLKTIPVHQTISVSEFERQAIEYSIPVDLGGDSYA